MSSEQENVHSFTCTDILYIRYFNLERVFGGT